MNPKTASIIFGIVFLLVGILGFIPNAIIYDSHEAIFHADTVHSSVHIVSGVLFLIIGLAMPDFAATFLKIFGIVYFFLGVLGLANIGTNGMTQLLGFLHVNGPDNVLHIVLGILIFAAGMFRPKLSTK
jgi:hypothetical protein